MSSVWSSEWWHYLPSVLALALEGPSAQAEWAPLGSGPGHVVLLLPVREIDTGLLHLSLEQSSRAFTMWKKTRCIPSSHSGQHVCPARWLARSGSCLDALTLLLENMAFAVYPSDKQAAWKDTPQCVGEWKEDKGCKDPISCSGVNYSNPFPEGKVWCFLTEILWAGGTHCQLLQCHLKQEKALWKHKTNVVWCWWFVGFSPSLI